MSQSSTPSRPTRKSPVKKLPPVRRRSLGATGEDWVEVRPLDPDRPYPTLVRPRHDALRLPEWIEQNVGFVRRLFDEKRSLLFRGFDLGGVEGFERVVDSVSEGGRLAYRDRSTPRETFGDRIYNTTSYPPQYRIRLHNEGSYWVAWALKAFFACLTAPPVGGATPIGDMHEAWRRIDPEIRQVFDRKQWMLVRNYNEGFGLPWQEVFQTDSRAEVEAYCDENDIELEWKDGGRLRTRQVRPAFRRHPKSGETLWFNHAAFFHHTALDAELHEALTADFAPDELPYNTYYGDGTPIESDVVRHVLDIYDELEIAFRWQEGDLHLIDNMRLAHARQAYEGDRLILVALTDGYRPPAPRSAESDV